MFAQRREKRVKEPSVLHILVEEDIADIKEHHLDHGNPFDAGGTFSSFSAS